MTSSLIRQPVINNLPALLIPSIVSNTIVFRLNAPALLPGTALQIPQTPVRQV